MAINKPKSTNIGSNFLLNMVEFPLDDRTYFLTKAAMKTFSNKTIVRNGTYFFPLNAGEIAYCLETQSYYFFNSRNADESPTMTIAEASAKELGYWEPLDISANKNTGSNIEIVDTLPNPVDAKEDKLYILKTTDAITNKVSLRLYCYTVANGFITHDENDSCEKIPKDEIEIMLNDIFHSNNIIVRKCEDNSQVLDSDTLAIKVGDNIMDYIKLNCNPTNIIISKPTIVDSSLTAIKAGSSDVTFEVETSKLSDSITLNIYVTN